MKTKNTIFFVVGIAALFISFNSFAQFSAGLDLGLPVGNFSNIASTGFGLSARYEAPITGQLNWTASAGFLSFSGKTYNIVNVSIPFGNTTTIPLTGGVKYYFMEANKGFYGAADVTVNFISTYVYTYNSGNGGGYNTSSDSKTVIGISPGVGYRLPNFDFSFRYNSAGDYSYLGIRAAYVFGGK